MDEGTSWVELVAAITVFYGVSSLYWRWAERRPMSDTAAALGWAAAIGGLLVVLAALAIASGEMRLGETGAILGYAVGGIAVILGVAWLATLPARRTTRSVRATDEGVVCTSRKRQSTLSWADIEAVKEFRTRGHLRRVDLLSKGEKVRLQSAAAMETQFIVGGASASLSEFLAEVDQRAPDARRVKPGWWER